MNKTEVPGYKLFSALAKSLPDKHTELSLLMCVGLASENKTISEEAAWGLYLWLTSAETLAPPDELIREIGIIIATRRKSLLNRALQVARWIFSKGSKEQQNTIAPLTLHGLNYLYEELRYDRDYDDYMDVPLLRSCCAHLAVAMESVVGQDDPIVRKWVEVLQNDPLPEVRFAKE